MLDCTTDTYDTLYARWLEKPGALLDWAEWVPHYRLLDLCGGTGAISLEALRRGAERVWLLDLSPRVRDERVTLLRKRAEDLDLKDSPYKPWDIVVCRQAIGYLDLRSVEGRLWDVLERGGRFVFNTFVRPKFSAKTYLHCGHRYFEASGFLGRRVFHLQAVRGDFDVTSFRWWTEQDIAVAFSRWTRTAFQHTGSTLWYSFRKPA